VKVCAALAAAWFLYAEVVFRPGGPLSQQVQQTFDFTPFYRAALVSVGVLAVVSILALTVAALQKGLAVAPGGLRQRAGS
jgi:hypothetical protein